MTALERAVDAVMSVERSYGDAFDVAEEGATNIVRAVLMAIREPDDFVVRAGEAIGTPGYETAADSVFTAMIDAILNETTE